MALNMDAKKSQGFVWPAQAACDGLGWTRKAS
jgi:hypothetical protein